MEFDVIMDLLERGDIGLKISVEDTDVVEIRVKDKNIDLDILDMDKLGRLREEFKNGKFKKA
ncbi:MAG: hypothetical protein V3R82_05005 [Candidatus Hydrothermarchaeales archaeon]